MPLPESVLLSTAYFPPVQYFTKLLFKTPVIEKFENYSKQSYRNRCVIFGANGPLTLVIPVIKNHGEKTLITGVKIDNYDAWQRAHLRSIVSAYRSSPFFEFYFDDIQPFFLKNYIYLYDLNLDIINKMLELCGIDNNISFSAKFEHSPQDILDFRDSIHPKKRMNKPDTLFISNKYQQVFSDKYGFISNLSIIDLIFNVGPEVKNILQTSLKKEG